ncbi:MAG TPA: AMP-binding protein [Streptosporangiaceae bacterium]|nr:AMP-binding protein [Streptosporangiaceae bacterium]
MPVTAPWRTVPSLLRTQAELHPDEVVVADGPVRISARALREQAHEFARALMALGVGAGDRVALWAPNGWQWVIAACGIWDAGAVVVPLSTRYKAIEAGDMLARTGASTLVANARFLGTDYLRILATEFGGPADGRPVKGLTDLRNVLVLDGPGALSHSHGYDEITDLAQSVDPDDAEARASAVRGEDVFSILATSGTTGEPKGVMLSSEQILRAYWDWSDIVGLRAGDPYPIVSPFAHGFGINAGLLASLMRLAQMHPIAVFDPDHALELIENARLSILAGPPALFARLLSRDDLARHDISSLRVAVVGAAAVPTQLVRQMLDVLGFERVVNAYGLMEGSFVTATRTGDPIEVVAATAGRPAPGMEVRIVDDAGQPRSAGERGEILIRGYGVMCGYWNAPELTREAVDPDGWLHTGDIGVCDDQGNLSIVDRKKEMFIVAGFNAYPAEIENLLARHPAVAQVGVVGIPDSRSGEVGCAFVVPAPGAELTPETLVAWARASMSNYKVPRRVFVVPELPLTSNGKVDKAALRARALEAV